MKSYNMFKDFKFESPVITDTGIQLKRGFSFTYYLYGVYKIMEHIDRFNGLNNIISLHEMVAAYDGWSGDRLPHTYLDRCNFILNFNSTAERDAAIPVLKKLCGELRIRFRTEQFFMGMDFANFSHMDIFPCMAYKETNEYRKRYKFMTADEVMRMEFFKDIRREREYEKQQLEEYEKSKQVG